jgi:hypothetical protein
MVKVIRSDLLGRSIIAHSPEGPERRQTPRLNQLHLDPPVFAIVLLVLRGVTENILVPQFHPDFGCDVW